MKKKILFLGLIMAFLLTGCGKDVKGYNENIYVPLREAVEILDENLGEYVEDINDIQKGDYRIDSEMMELYANDFIDAKDDVNDVDALESFNEDEKKAFDDMKKDLDSAMDGMGEVKDLISELYTNEPVEEKITEYNEKVKTVNGALDSFLEKFNAINKEYKVKEKAEIKNRPTEFKAQEKAEGQLTTMENSMMETLMSMLNTEEASKNGIKAEIDKESKTVYIVFGDDMYVADKALARETVTDVSKEILTTTGNGFTVKLIQGTNKDKSFYTVKDGEVVEDNLK